MNFKVTQGRFFDLKSGNTDFNYVISIYFVALFILLKIFDIFYNTFIVIYRLNMNQSDIR